MSFTSPAFDEVAATSCDGEADAAAVLAPADAALAHAVVGLGRFGSTHARKLAGLPGFHLRALVDPSATLPGPALGGLPLLRHVDELPTGIASATVATSDAAHAEVAIALMKRGCHVLVEKPLCLVPEEGARMLRVAARHRVTLCAGHIERFNPLFDEARLASLRLASLRQRGSPQLFLRFRRVSSREATAADSVLDLMVHDLDLLAWLCAIADDEPLALIDRDLRADGVRARVRLGGLVAELESGYGAAAPAACMEVPAGRGCERLDLRDPVACRPSASDALSRQYAAFRRAIRGEPGRIATGREGLAAVTRARQILGA